MSEVYYDNTGEYPYKVHRFTVTTETEYTFRVYSDDPIFSEQEFAALNDRDKYRILLELPDVDHTFRTIWNVTRYRGEVTQWQG